MTDVFVYTTPDDERSQPLIEALIEEYEGRYGDYFGEPARNELSRYPASYFAQPDGAFLLLIRDGETIGGGAFKRYDERTAELKRIWTHSRLRQQGLARKVVYELEAQAFRQGYTRIYLTTGFRQPEATQLYLRSGYTALFDVNVDPEIYRHLAFEKDISHLLTDGVPLAREEANNKTQAA
ncbi:GNAT family N-acetyltransferase [Phyllobacterium sp. YR531]|uniref:GNAT family N-acetyltransferase n=1 Tax=Phyllobacterium sp. YR531 TaxID=1144343 RepID=UPI00026FC3D5|nr:GNAT family N-acetyltransferase [Phyllobacterium sp. YR531]EJN02383.1 acetyltransferase, N-acetylglutamate synthase [Phyllobacterium sp. YR531]